ncbi:Metalloenzyme, LuxS/M16 peptidase-like protein [Fusarium oxysporum]|nr:Metalloenzyme, LuxS/M16 peptidase-like protein [Fusarium oxysporum]
MLVTDSLKKPSLNDRDYRIIRLNNELEALRMHDSETDKASAALDINVGNFSDESDISGTVHAVEYFFLMGTKKFSIENEYSQRLSANSGTSNAYTGSTSMNYFFYISVKPDNGQDPSDTNPSPLSGALDRFAQFFIEPLFLSETLDRELKALEKSLSNPNHPFCHFSTGNFEVLKTLSEARGIDVRDKFIAEPLDVLQKWIAKLFSPVVNKKLSPNRWPGELPFREELNLYFPFIDEEFMFATQPSRYISHLIGHEGPGSIMSYIRSKGWANGLNAGAYPMCPGTPGILDMQVCLTEDGLKNYPEIIEIFFPYIALLQQKGIADVDFKFKLKTPASRFTSRISSVMQKTLPRKWLLSGHSRLREFAPDQIEKALATIRPDNSCMEKWYGTEYRHDKIPNDLMQECKKAFAVSPQDRLPTLHLPHKNQFIPNEPEVEKQEMDEQALNPRVIRNDSIARTQWKKDDIFWVSRANVIVSLKTPLFYASAENNVKARLFSDLVCDALEMYSYDAELAGLQYKIPVLLDQIVTTMRDLDINKYRFETVKQRLTRGYNWQLQSSHHQVGDYTNWLNAPERDFIVEELAAELSGVTWRVFIEVYVHGNMYKEDALKATDMVAPILKPRVLPKAHREDRDIRTKTLIRGPAFDQLRTKEPFGYIVFSMPRTFSMTYGFRFLIQSEMAPKFLDSRSEAFLVRYADTLEKMNDTEFEGPKRSLITAQRDAAQIKLLTKLEVMEFLNRRLNPVSSRRDRLSIHLQAQGKAEGVDKRQEEAQKNANMETSAGDDVKMAEEITDGRLFKAGLTASLGARPVKDISECDGLLLSTSRSCKWGGESVFFIWSCLLSGMDSQLATSHIPHGEAQRQIGQRWFCRYVIHY